jgi:hypothetical protein
MRWEELEALILSCCVKYYSSKILGFALLPFVDPELLAESGKLSKTSPVETAST